MGNTYLVDGLDSNVPERLGVTEVEIREAFVKPITVFEVESVQVVPQDGVRGRVFVVMPDELEARGVLDFFPATDEVDTGTRHENRLLLAIRVFLEEFDFASPELSHDFRCRSPGSVWHSGKSRWVLFSMIVSDGRS